jgi:uncharacterized membrane protein
MLWNLLAILVAMTSVPGVLEAQLTFCNASPLTMEMAVGYPSGTQWFARGWYVLDSGECGVVVSEPLTNRYYYGFAQTAGGGMAWPGTQPMCVSGNKFTLPNGSCDEAVKNFEMLDVGNQRSFSHAWNCTDCVDANLANAVNSLVPVLTNLANEQAPLNWRTTDWQDIGPVDIQYGVSRGNFAINITANTVLITTRVSYWLSVSNNLPIVGRNGLASCGVNEPQPIVDVTIEITLGMKRDGHLHSKTRNQLSFSTPCNLTIANIDVRSYIKAVVQPQVDRLASALDARIATVDLSSVLDPGAFYHLK